MTVIYIDPGLRDNLGHHANTCRFVTGELRRRGIEPLVLACDQLVPELQAELGAKPYFRHYTYWSNDGDPVCGWLTGFFAGVEQTLQDLVRLPPLGARDLVYLNSAQPAELLAIVSWLSRLAPERLPQVVVEFGTDPGVDAVKPPHAGNPGAQVHYATRDPRNDPRAAFFRLAARQIPPQLAKHLHMMTFERHTSSVFSLVLNQPVGVLPVPHHAIGSLRNRAGTHPLTITVLGHQRPDKGYHYMPEIAKELLVARGERIRLLVHNGAPEQMRGAQQAMRDLAAKFDQIIMDERIAGLQIWAQLLDASDIILCPYEPARFDTSYSAVAVEAVANAIPLVVPTETSLERLVHDWGGCGTLFSKWEPTSIVQATIEAIDDFDRLAGVAYAAAERWPYKCGPERLVDAMLSFTSP